MSLFRNIVWFTKGLSEYTRGGYVKASKYFKQGDLDVDCGGRVFMVTGANSGIGKEFVKEAAKRQG